MPTKNQMSFEKIRSTFYFGVTLILFVAFLYLIRPFLFPIFWAAIIAILLSPLYKFINKYIDVPSLSAIIGVILVIVLILLPLSLLVFLLIQQAIMLYNTFINDNFFHTLQNLMSWLEKGPFANLVQGVSSQWLQDISGTVKTVSLFLIKYVGNIAQNSAVFVGMFLIMIYALYYFFKDGEKLLRRLTYISPLDGKYERMFFDKFISTAASTLKSTFIVGGIQGLLGGILFFATGIKGALIWGVIMMALSFIPAVGASIIWFPAGIIMIMMGNVWKGVLILLVGTFIISLIDNLLRPQLVKKDTEMHPVITLLSTLGGIIIFGISGFVIGPIIAAMFLAMISMYTHYYSNELRNN